MSISSAYQKSLEPGIELPQPSISSADDAYFLELKSSWVRHEYTSKFLKDLRQEIDALEKKAREFAFGYHVNQNHQQIVQLLVRAETLRKIVETYAR